MSVARDNRRMRLARASLVALLVVAACEGTDGLAGADPEPAGDGGGGGKRDAGGQPDGGAGLDGGLTPDTKRCDPLEPFGPPELQTDLEPTADMIRSAVLSPDELEIHYLRYTGAGSVWELRRATRPNQDARWANATTIEGLAPVAGMSLSAGGLKIHYWTVDSNFVASRATVDDHFANPKHFWLPNKPQVFDVAADDAGYLAAYVGDATTDKAIMRAAMTTNAGGLLTPVEVPNIHVRGAIDSQPVTNTDETALYFSSNRAGGKGLADIWVARRATKLEPFGVPVHVPELSTDTFDAVSWVSDDDCEILIERASHIYRSKRPL